MQPIKSAFIKMFFSVLVQSENTHIGLKCTSHRIGSTINITLYMRTRSIKSFNVSAIIGTNITSFRDLDIRVACSYDQTVESWPLLKF